MNPKALLAVCALSVVTMSGCGSVLTSNQYKCVKTTDGKTIDQVVSKSKCKGKGK